MSRFEFRWVFLRFFLQFGNAVFRPVLTQHHPQFYYGSHLNHIIIIIIIIIISIIIVSIVIVMTIIIIRIIIYFLNDFYGTLSTEF